MLICHLRKSIRTDPGHQLIASQLNVMQRGAWTAQNRRLDRVGPSQCRNNPGVHPGSQWLPDIPKVTNWATALLILSATPWLLVFVNNIFSTPIVVSKAEFLAPGYGVILLTIGYLVLAVCILNGHKWTRIAIAAITVPVDFFMLTGVTSLERYLGQVGDAEVGAVSFVLLLTAWTAVLSGIGLVLLYTPASNTYINRSEAYKSYIDQQNPTRSPELRIAGWERR